MNKKFSSKLLLNKEDFAIIYDYKYKPFLPCLCIFIAMFAGASPFFKGLNFLPVFIMLLIAFLIFLGGYVLLNKKIKQEIDSIFLNNQLIFIDTDFYEDKIVVKTSKSEETINYKSVIKIEEYETLYLIYTKNKKSPLAISKEAASLKDGSDLLDFIKAAAKPKRKKVKKIRLRKQKAFITVIVLAVFAFSTLMPLIYMFAYNLFDYGRFGIR